MMGIIWFVISIVIDLVMFLPESPMQMTFAEYMMDIGVTYFIIIVIPLVIGYMLEQKSSQETANS